MKNPITYNEFLDKVVIYPKKENENIFVLFIRFDKCSYSIDNIKLLSKKKLKSLYNQIMKKHNSDKSLL